MAKALTAKAAAAASEFRRPGNRDLGIVRHGQARHRGPAGADRARPARPVALDHADLRAGRDKCRIDAAGEQGFRGSAPGSRALALTTRRVAWTTMKALCASSLRIGRA